MAAITQPRGYMPLTGRRFGSFAGKTVAAVVAIDHAGVTSVTAGFVRSKTAGGVTVETSGHVRSENAAEAPSRPR